MHSTLRLGLYGVQFTMKSHRTAFCTSPAPYEWFRMPQGAASASGCFRRSVKRVTKGLDHVVMYLDVAITFNASPTSHIRTQREFYSFLRTHDLKLSPGKARLGATELGSPERSILPAGLNADTNKVREITEPPMPTNPA